MDAGDEQYFGRRMLIASSSHQFSVNSSIHKLFMPILNTACGVCTLTCQIIHGNKELIRHNSQAITECVKTFISAFTSFVVIINYIMCNAKYYKEYSQPLHRAYAYFYKN